jgi:hypothetical protein
MLSTVIKPDDTTGSVVRLQTTLGVYGAVFESGWIELNGNVHAYTIPLLVTGNKGTQCQTPKNGD